MQLHDQLLKVYHMLLLLNNSVLWWKCSSDHIFYSGLYRLEKRCMINIGLVSHMLIKDSNSWQFYTVNLDHQIPTGNLVAFADWIFFGFKILVSKSLALWIGIRPSAMRNFNAVLLKASLRSSSFYIQCSINKKM